MCYFYSDSEKNGYSVDVLTHVKNSTAFCIYSIIGKKDQAKTMKTKIKDAKKFKSNIEKGTILGLQAIASNIGHDKTVDSCYKLAKLAVSYAPNCALWHYVIANYLRKKRRFKEFCPIVSEEEQNEFLKCYKLSQSIDYSVCVARMYKESKNWQKSSEMFDTIYESGNTNMRVRLNLALHYINKKNFVKAKSCLDGVIKLLPPEVTLQRYYHYLAKYHEKTNNYLVSI